MGYVPIDVSQTGRSFTVEVRGKQINAQVTPLPFVPHRTRPRATM